MNQVRGDLSIRWEATHGVQVGGLFVAGSGNIIATHFECLDVERLANIADELKSAVIL